MSQETKIQVICVRITAQSQVSVLLTRSFQTKYPKSLQHHTKLRRHASKCCFPNSKIPFLQSLLHNLLPSSAFPYRPFHLEKAKSGLIGDFPIHFSNSYPTVKNYHSMGGKNRTQEKLHKNLTNSWHSFYSSIVPNIVCFVEQVIEKVEYFKIISTFR